MNAANKKFKNEDPTEDYSGKAMTALSETLCESLKNEEEDADVFEVYTHALKTKIYKPECDLSSRLNKGYHALLEQLISSQTK